jgi:hypothetical protein
MTLAQDLARWAHEFEPSASDLALAERSLRDTVAVALAGAEHPVVQYAQEGSVALSRNWPCKIVDRVGVLRGPVQLNATVPLILPAPVHNRRCERRSSTRCSLCGPRPRSAGGVLRAERDAWARSPSSRTQRVPPRQ